jgi:alkylation response protein AidB-like acyl-CoA dehydrogenase
MTGEWGGTMCLTEPDAGSDVGNLKTKAVSSLMEHIRTRAENIYFIWRKRLLQKT